MNSSKAKTVAEYLNELSPERRRVIEETRAMILKNLPEGYMERMNWGMISYEVPLDRFAETYNGQPLTYLSLSTQKKHNSLYMMGVYADPEQEGKLVQAYKDAGKRIDMGKSCVRFKVLDDLPVSMIEELIASTEVDAMIALHNRAHKR